MLGGSEFRLRRGFACGKTLVRRFGATGQKAGWMISYNAQVPSYGSERVEFGLAVGGTSGNRAENGESCLQYSRLQGLKWSYNAIKRRSAGYYQHPADLLCCALNRSGGVEYLRSAPLFAVLAKPPAGCCPGPLSGIGRLSYPAASRSASPRPELPSTRSPSPSAAICDAIGTSSSAAAAV